MSGHSKWKTIQHKKGAADAKRGKIFSKLSKEIAIAAREGGGDPDMNPGLRTLLLNAKNSNMPADNIERAVKKGTGTLEGLSLEEVFYEGYASGGVALVVKALTDNKNRAAAEIRHIFTKFGSNLASQGSVTRSFKRKGQIIVDASTVDEDKLMGIVLDSGAEDMQRDEGVFEIVTDPASFLTVIDALEKADVHAVSSEVTLLPDNTVQVTDKAVAAALIKFIEALEDSDDVQNVYSNMDLDDAVLKEMEET
ncbi:YebC/PmpR family DNA-binding transcriptional regulator [Verrucomicrobiota bacterium]